MEASALICLVKRLYETYSGDSVYTTCHWKLSLCYWTLRHFSNNTFTFYKYLFRTSCSNTSSANKSRSYLHILVCCCGLEFQFLSTPTHSRFPSRSTRSTFTYPNRPSSFGYNTSPAGKGVFSFVDYFQTYSGVNQDSYSKSAWFRSPKSSDRGGRLTAV